MLPEDEVSFYFFMNIENYLINDNLIRMRLNFSLFDKEPEIHICYYK